MRMRETGVRLDFWRRCKATRRPAHCLQAVLQSLDETERRNDNGDWVEEVGRNLFFNSPVKGRPGGEGGGGEG